MNVPQTKPDLIARIGFAVIVLAAGISFLFFWQVFFPEPTTTFAKTSNLPVDKHLVHPGDTVGVTVEYCKSKPAISNIVVGFVDGQLVDTFQTVRNLPIGCHKARLDVLIPSNMVNDHYSILLQVHYENASLLREEVHQLSSEKFLVVP